MKRLSIRARMTLWYTGILAATVLVLGSVAYGLLMRGLWNEVDGTLERVARAAAQARRRKAPITTGMAPITRRAPRAPAEGDRGGMGSAVVATAER